jgi:hypothetical protein
MTPDKAGHQKGVESSAKGTCTVSAHYKFATKVQCYARLHAYAATSWGLGSSETLRSADWYLVTDVSGKPLGPIFKGPTCSLFADVSGQAIVSI